MSRPAELGPLWKDKGQQWLQARIDYATAAKKKRIERVADRGDLQDTKKIIPDHSLIKMSLALHKEKLKKEKKKEKKREKKRDEKKRKREDEGTPGGQRDGDAGAADDPSSSSEASPTKRHAAQAPHRAPLPSAARGRAAPARAAAGQRRDGAAAAAGGAHSEPQFAHKSWCSGNCGGKCDPAAATLAQARAVDAALSARAVADELAADWARVTAAEAAKAPPPPEEPPADSPLPSWCQLGQTQRPPLPQQRGGGAQQAAAAAAAAAARGAAAAKAHDAKFGFSAEAPAGDDSSAEC